MRRYAEAVEAGNAAQACSLVGEAALLRLRRRGLGCEDEIASLRAGVDANGLVSRPHGGETRAELQVQLDQGEVRAAVIDKRAHAVHLTLNGGRHALFAYPAREGSAVAKALIDNGEAAVTFLSPSQARFRASPGSG